MHRSTPCRKDSVMYCKENRVQRSMVCAGRRQVAISMRTLSGGSLSCHFTKPIQKVYSVVAAILHNFTTARMNVTPRDKNTNYCPMQHPSSCFSCITTRTSFPTSCIGILPPQLIDTLALQHVLTMANYGAPFLCSPMTGKFSPILFSFMEPFSLPLTQGCHSAGESPQRMILFFSVPLGPGIEIR